MEPESPSPYPQVPATCPYPEPTPSSPHDSLQQTTYVILVGIHVALMTRYIFCFYLPDRLRGVAMQKTAIRKRNDNLEDLSLDGMIIFKGI
jgi:hypothetical protein